jgi:hypothetical protein
MFYHNERDDENGVYKVKGSYMNNAPKNDMNSLSFMSYFEIFNSISKVEYLINLKKFNSTHILKLSLYSTKVEILINKLIKVE